MRTARFIAALALATEIARPASPAAAQPPPTDDRAIELFSEPDLKALPPDEKEPAPERRARASERFKAGQTAFSEQRYPIAAEAFEQAFALAPHHAALWNAARARESAGQKRLAANHYQRFLDTAPADARGRPEARKSMEALIPQLGRLDITAVGATRVTVNGDPVHGATYYADVGEQHVIAQFPHGQRDARVTSTAGVRTPVTLSAPAAPAIPAAAPGSRSAGPAPAGPTTRDQPREDDDGGWSPLVVVVGGIVTLAFAGTGIWSAVDGQDANDAFAADPSEENKQDRNRVNFRTITVFGLATGAAIFTTITAVWLVDWGSDDDTTSVVLTPGGLAVSGRF